MQHFSFIVVNFNICRQVNKPETVTVSHQAPVKKRKPTVNAICDYQNRGHLDKVDQLDDGKITIQSRKLVVNQLSRNEINDMDRNQPVTYNLLLWPFKPAE